MAHAGMTGYRTRWMQHGVPLASCLCLCLAPGAGHAVQAVPPAGTPPVAGGQGAAQQSATTGTVAAPAAPAAGTAVQQAPVEEKRQAPPDDRTSGNVTGSPPPATSSVPVQPAQAVPLPTAVAGSRGVLFRISRPAPPPAERQAADASGMQAQTGDGGTAQIAVPPASPGATAAAPQQDAKQEGAMVADAAQAASPAVPVSYLLGTIHFGDPQEHAVDYARLEELLGQSKVFVNELDPAIVLGPEDGHYVFLPAGEQLSDLVGRKAFSSARRLLPETREEELERSKPWRVLALLEARGERASEKGMDARLQAMARERGLHPVHLETLSAQMDALGCVSDDEEAIVLVQRLERPEFLAADSARTLQFYRDRDLEGWLADVDRMEGLDADARSIEARARKCLLADRNKAWAVELQELLAKESCFIAVGALHLAGEDGLVARLRRAGFVVEAIPL